MAPRSCPAGRGPSSARRALPLVLCALLAVSLLAACAGGETEADAVSGAIAASAIAADAEDVTVSEVEVDGARASAEVALAGGGFGGQTLAVTLAETEAGWEIEEISAFVAYDGAALAAALEERFEAISDEISPAQVSCVGDLVREAPRAKMEALLLTGDSSGFVEFAEACE